jgi:hypothetical protein
MGPREPTPGDTFMSRTFLFVSGAICWTVAAVDAAVHLAAGDLLVPAVMGAIFVVWIGLRRHQLALARTEI